MATLKSLMDKYFSNTEFNDQWCRKLAEYYYRLFTKDENTLAFFGDGLWGVYPIYFLPQDVNILYDDFLQIDDLALKKDVHSLEEIDPKWKVSSDIVNLTLLYLVHRLLTGQLSDEKKTKYSVYCLNILQFKFLSSMQNRKFPYGVNKSIAVAVFSRLTRKYMIKVCGNWKSLIDYRANDIISKSSIHYKTLISFEGTYAVMVTVNEIQNRAKKMINSLTDEFHTTKDQDKSIGVRSKIISDEEGERLTDNINQFKIYRKYLQSILADRRSLIKKEVIDIVETSTAKMPKGALEDILSWLSDNSYGREHKSINTFLDDLLEYSFSIIRDNKLKTNDISNIIIKLRAMFLSSRVTNEKLMRLKEVCLKLVEKGTKFNNISTTVTLRTALMLYLVLRTITMKYFG